MYSRLTENKHPTFQCSCCGYFTLPERPSNPFEICPVCDWEDDGVQFLDPDYTGGANRVGLNQARQNYRLFGASDLACLNRVRPPIQDERAD
ncbi:MAG: hydrolase [Bacteroidetes bacterium]|nr:hydrolase [Fibrella sp.]